MKIRVPGVVARPIVAMLLLYRRVRYGYKFRRIPLTKGKFAIVDPQDYVWLKNFKWYASDSRGEFYAVRTALVWEGRKESVVWMHKEIMPVAKGMVVDHINHNTRDNRRANLRPANQRQNAYNRRKVKNTKNKYKGVYKVRDKWRVIIKIDGKRTNLGYFDSEIEAARAYDRAARRHHKEFAVVNLP